MECRANHKASTGEVVNQVQPIITRTVTARNDASQRMATDANNLRNSLCNSSLNFYCVIFEKRYKDGHWSNKLIKFNTTFFRDVLHHKLILKVIVFKREVSFDPLAPAKNQHVSRGRENSPIIDKADN